MSTVIIIINNNYFDYFLHDPNSVYQVDTPILANLSLTGMGHSELSGK